MVLFVLISSEIGRFVSMLCAQLFASFAEALVARNSSAVLAGSLGNTYGDGLYTSEFSFIAISIYSGVSERVEIAPSNRYGLDRTTSPQSRRKRPMFDGHNAAFPMF